MGYGYGRRALASAHAGVRNAINICPTFGHWLAVSLVIALVWTGIGFNLWRERQLATQEAAEETNNLARAYKENVSRTVEAIDERLLFVRGAYQHDGAAFDPDAWFREHPFLDGLQVQIAIADRTGDVTWSSLGPADHISIADRDHFRIPAASHDDTLYISAPVLGRISGQRTVQFVRKLLAPDGSFNGVVIIAADPKDLSKFYRSISYNSIITLTNTAGEVLAHAPDSQAWVGRTLSQVSKDWMRSGTASGTRRILCTADGIDRIVSFQKLERYPLVVNVGLAADDVFLSYDWSVRIYLLAGGLISVATIVVGLIMLRQRRSLFDSQQALAAALENMSQGIMMIRGDGSVPVINQRAVELLGLPLSLMTRNLSLEQIVEWQFANNEFGEAGSSTNRIADLAREHRTAGTNYAYERTRPNGTVLEVRTRSLPDRGAVRTFTDVTERVRNEQALQEAQARAAHAERMQVLGRLAGGIAHDFNNILQIVQSSASLIESRGDGGGNAGRLARIILDATDRGTSITRRLLSFARRGDLVAEAVDPALLLHDLSDVLRRTLGSMITVQVDVGPDVPRLLADKGQLETILVNLATNARDAMAQGGMLTFVAEVEAVPEGAAHRAELAPGRYVHLSISDTGTGMDKATLSRVLEPFFTTKPKGKGTGLGLSMAKGFMEQSGGGMAIDSTLGRGTAVHLWLPVTECELNAPGRHRAALRDDSQGPRRILLVDDEAMVRETMADLLQGLGYITLTADSGADALALLEAGETVDVLVTDLSMPEMDGLVLMKEARRGQPHLPVILLTGYSGDGAQTAITGEASDGFIVLRKPVTATHLADRIEALLTATTGASQG